VLDDIIDNVLRRVIDAAGLAHLGLFLDFGAVTAGEGDALAEKLLVGVAEHLHRQLAELVGAGIIEVFNDLLFFEMEQARVVALVGAVVNFHQTLVAVFAVEQRLQGAVGLDAAILGHAQKDQAVDSHLHGEIELAPGQAGVAQGDVARQHDAPLVQAVEKIAVQLRRAALALLVLDKAVKSTAQHRLFGKGGGDFVPLVDIVVKGIIGHAAHVRLVDDRRFDARIVHTQLFKIGEHGNRQFGRVGIAPQLECRLGIVLEIARRLFRFQEKDAAAADRTWVSLYLGFLYSRRLYLNFSTSWWMVSGAAMVVPSWSIF